MEGRCMATQKVCLWNVIDGNEQLQSSSIRLRGTECLCVHP